MEKQLWKREFGSKFTPPQEIVQLIEHDEHVQDDSYHHDICPHLGFYAEGTRRDADALVELWWDAIERQDRELDRERYLVVLRPNADGEEVLLTDDIGAALAKFAEWRKAAEKQS